MHNTAVIGNGLLNCYCLLLCCTSDGLGEVDPSLSGFLEKPLGMAIGLRSDESVVCLISTGEIVLRRD